VRTASVNLGGQEKRREGLHVLVFCQLGFFLEVGFVGSSGYVGRLLAGLGRIKKHSRMP